MKKINNNLVRIKKNLIFNKEIDYIKNYVFFLKKNIKIYYPLLIPQQDSEIIIHAYNYIKTCKKKNNCELGYGSNNINSSINKKKEKLLNVDKEFLCYITKNKKKNNNWILNNWIFLFNTVKKYNIIFSNPPYIDKKELIIKKKDKKKKYCILAKNGIYEIKLIIEKSKEILKKNGNIIIEHSYKQSKKIKKISKLNGFTYIYVLKDKNNIKRTSILER